MMNCSVVVSDDGRIRFRRKSRRKYIYSDAPRRFGRNGNSAREYSDEVGCDFVAAFVPGRNFARAVSALSLGLGKQVLLFLFAPNLWLPLKKKSAFCCKCRSRYTTSKTKVLAKTQSPASNSVFASKV